MPCARRSNSSCGCGVAQSETSELHHRFETLTPREREVLAAIAAGRLNKQIAGDLGIVEQTVKFHRARIMERMQAKTVAELMHLAAQLGIGAATRPMRRSSDFPPARAKPRKLGIHRGPRPSIPKVSFCPARDAVASPVT